MLPTVTGLLLPPSISNYGEDSEDLVATAVNLPGLGTILNRFLDDFYFRDWPKCNFGS